MISLNPNSFSGAGIRCVNRIQAEPPQKQSDAANRKVLWIQPSITTTTGRIHPTIIMRNPCIPDKRVKKSNITRFAILIAAAGILAGVSTCVSAQIATGVPVLLPTTAGCFLLGLVALACCQRFPKTDVPDKPTR